MSAKIEAMTVEEIKLKLQWHGTGGDNDGCLFCRLILTWAQAEARARKAEFWGYHQEYDIPEDCVYCRENYFDGIASSVEKHRWTEDDWLAAVKREIGWPED